MQGRLKCEGTKGSLRWTFRLGSQVSCGLGSFATVLCIPGRLQTFVGKTFCPYAALFLSLVSGSLVILWSQCGVASVLQFVAHHKSVLKHAALRRGTRHSCASRKNLRVLRTNRSRQMIRLGTPWRKSNSNLSVHRTYPGYRVVAL